MKKIGIIICAVSVLCSCGNELDVDPQGVLTEDLLAGDVGSLERFLFSAYAILDGNLDDSDVWRSAPSNWVYGEVASDNAYKGSEPGDQTPIDNIEAYTPNATSSFFEIKYRALYDGISKANASIVRTTDGLNFGLEEEDANQLIGEARFLRGHYHFEGKKMWNKIVYVDENTLPGATNTTDDSVWDSIEADFQFGIDNMAETSEVGRANSWMAKTYLAKVHLYQGDFAAAKPLLDEVINGGPYALNARFSDNFDGEDEQSDLESIFAIQYFVNEGIGNDSTGNWGDILNFPQTTEVGGGCCGFFQPSQNLVNAFKTGDDGLPLLDTFNDVDVINEEAQFNAYVAANGNEDGYDETFELETGNLDPRLDRTVGRRGIDFQGWGLHPGRSWIRDMANAGPYLGKKTMHRADQAGDVSTSGAAWSGNVNGINIHIIRFAEVLLWRAEIAAAEGDLGAAVALVDRVRARAANSEDFVTVPGTITPAANYVISEYGNFTDQEQAIKAVEHEQRIELAMEGHRFFELVRKGTAAQVLNDYTQEESETRSYLSGVLFGSGNEFYPFPQAIIDESQGVLTSN